MSEYKSHNFCSYYIQVIDMVKKFTFDDENDVDSQIN